MPGPGGVPVSAPGWCPLPGGYLVPGGSARGGGAWSGGLPLGEGVVSQYALRQTPPPVNRMTDRQV